MSAQEESSESRQGKWGAELGYGDVMEPEQLLQIPVFEGISKGLLEKNRGAVVRRTFRAGEIMCREGEYGSTAFYILEGKAEVFISTPLGHASSTTTTSRSSRRTTVFPSREQSPRTEETKRTTISIDGPVDLSYDSPTAELVPGELFGEMTCMNFYPRSATVQAKTDCVVLEMLRNILDILLKNPKFKAQIDKDYRERALEDHLNHVPMFAALKRTQNLPDLVKASEFIQHLLQTVELQRVPPGQVICKQGDPADSFYLVRLGFVRVSQTYPGGEVMLGYLSRGDYFGEIGLLGGGIRSASCTALDHVELVKVSGADFQAMVEKFPQVRTALEQVARERQQENDQILETVQSVPLDDFLGQGLMNAQNLLVLDLHKCTRCDLCVVACADTHEGITRLVREGLRFENYLVATSCRQCRDPLCMVGCPVGSIRRKNSLEIVIEDWCVGCGLCAKNCPYGNINMHPIKMVADATGAAQAVGHAIARAEDAERIAKAAMKKKALTCDLCSDLDEPSCVYACPHDAAHRVHPRRLFREARTEGHPGATDAD